jgi:hypothetical protein
MNPSSAPPLTISELADRLERIREELFSVQKALERMEPVEAVRSAESPNKSSVGCDRQATVRRRS